MAFFARGKCVVLTLLECQLIHNASFLVTEVGDMEQERNEDEDFLLTLNLLHFCSAPSPYNIG